MERREDGVWKIFADAAGQEFSVRTADIVTIEDSTRSLMPEAFGDVLTPEQFADLLAFLLR